MSGPGQPRADRLTWILPAARRIEMGRGAQLIWEGPLEGLARVDHRLVGRSWD